MRPEMFSDRWPGYGLTHIFIQNKSYGVFFTKECIVRSVPIALERTIVATTATAEANGSAGQPTDTGIG